jgi:hypothetical protein
MLLQDHGEEAKLEHRLVWRATNMHSHKHRDSNDMGASSKKQYVHMNNLINNAFDHRHELTIILSSTLRSLKSGVQTKHDLYRHATKLTTHLPLPLPLALPCLDPLPLALGALASDSLLSTSMSSSLRLF